jgi:NADH-quinone oxidoreductase subunit N
MEDFNGLMRKSPWLTVMMTIFLLSLGGIPPTAGFIGKFYLFAGLIKTGNVWMVRLAILAVLMSAVSLYYYIRFIRAMYIEPETAPEPVRLAAPLHIALGLAAAMVLYIGIFPQRVIDFTRKAGLGLVEQQTKSESPAPPRGAQQPGAQPPGAPPRQTTSPPR